MTAPTTSAGTALKPCPFCGGAARFGTVRYSDRHVAEQEWEQSTFHFVNCEMCGATNQGIIGRQTPEAARNHWNRRIEEAAHA